MVYSKQVEMNSPVSGTQGSMTPFSNNFDTPASTTRYSVSETEIWLGTVCWKGCTLSIYKINVIMRGTI